MIEGYEIARRVATAGRFIRWIVPYALLLAPARAFAGPSNADVDDLFSYFGVEGRAFGGIAGGFTDIGVAGGDVHVAFEGAPFGVLVGARIGTNFGDTQFVLADVAVRYFPLPSNDLLFVGGGGFYGPEFTSSFDATTGTIGGFFAEVGLEYPRASQARVVASLRVDFGFPAKASDAVLTPPPFAPMVTLDFGFFFGGKGTTLHHDS